MADDFDQLVCAQIERLKSKTLSQIESEVTLKRTHWLQAQDQSMYSHPTPRVAFEALFFQYMGLTPDDLPILHEDEREIVWSSRNPCPTLEACKSLGLDTRIVCRKAYEKSTQAFVSWIDPELRFVRDYRNLRPHATHCLEKIVRVDFKTMMRIAIEQAKVSKEHGDKRYGAVITLGDRILSRTHDTATTEGDPSLHAEVNAIRTAAQVLGDSNLSGAILFSSCEPCPMCSSLAVWANLSAIVFGASIEKTAAFGRTRIMLSAEEVIRRSPALVEVIPGILETECLKLYE